MGTQLCMIAGFACAFGVAIWLASKSGSKAAQLEALKAELKRIAEENARAQGIIYNVRRSDIERVREKLQDTK